MKRTKWLSAVFVLFVAMAGYVHAADKPMNILVLYADDWRYNAMGCAGNARLDTVGTPQSCRRRHRRLATT